jgi:hypothetical protein
VSLDRVDIAQYCDLMRQGKFRTEAAEELEIPYREIAKRRRYDKAFEIEEQMAREQGAERREREERWCRSQEADLWQPAAFAATVHRTVVPDGRWRGRTLGELHQRPGFTADNGWFRRALLAQWSDAEFDVEFRLRLLVFCALHRPDDFAVVAREAMAAFDARRPARQVDGVRKLRAADDPDCGS